MNDDERPSPEELLTRYDLRDPPSPDPQTTATQGPSRRGRLRIYLGMAAGVGKTYAMLNAGRRRKARGIDVVIGFVETHGRPLTAQQVGDLEIIPRQKVAYRGVELEEMDTPAILARHPVVVLVDELAHTNVPGSLHEKRYEDVEELLEAGISVISTLNVQHLESLNDLVESITGIRQRETIPDRILDEADEVEFIDISPESLRARMRHGNIYPADRAQQALSSYFNLSNLTALRELALRRMAEKTEEQLETLMRTDEEGIEPLWGTTATERVMVAFDGRPNATHLLRAAARLARGLKAQLLAVTILTQKTTPSDRLSIGKMAELAEDLEAEVITFEGRDVPAALAEIAREYRVTQIVIGPPSRPSWQEMLGGSVVNRLLRAGLDADIHVVSERQEL